MSGYLEIKKTYGQAIKKLVKIGRGPMVELQTNLQPRINWGLAALEKQNIVLVE